MSEVRPYGSWSSPITAASLVKGAVAVNELVTDGDDVWWSESRPDEGGRVAIVVRRQDTKRGQRTQLILFEVDLLDVIYVAMSTWQKTEVNQRALARVGKIKR